MDADSEQLSELALLGRLDELFALVSVEDAARAWCGYNSRPHHSDREREEDADWWAVDLWFSLAGKDEGRERQMLRLIADLAPDDDVLSALGAGPLEDFVTDDEDRLEWIETQAASSEKFRKALANVWARDYVAAENFARLERAAGRPLR